MILQPIRTFFYSALAVLAVAIVLALGLLEVSVVCLAKTPASIARMKAFMQRAVCRFRPSYSGGIHIAAVAV